LLIQCAVNRLYNAEWQGDYTLMNLNGCGMKQGWPDVIRKYSDICLEDLGKPQKLSGIITDLWTKILPWGLSAIKRECKPDHYISM